VWRKRSTVGSLLAASPTLEAAMLNWVPVPCRLFPERVAELPPLALMPKQMREPVEAWPPPVDFAAQLSAARGTKAGGWPRTPEPVRCTVCVHPMDFLLTIDSCEWTATDAVRWKPLEDSDTDGYRRAAGLTFSKPETAVQLFLCKRCEKWPVRGVLT
jgi:hypothetical protein